MRITRRHFLATAASASALALASSNVLASGIAGTVAAVNHHRYSVNTPEGQKMLASYARGVQAMLALPPENPHNWYRHAFIHLMDCPHGNWWFYIWHRGYVAHLEQMIRRYSNDANFAMPYWDWTSDPQLPASLFDGVLTPTDAAYLPYSGPLEARIAVKPALQAYWNGLDRAQRDQLALRGYAQFENLWNDVTGYDTGTGRVIAGNAAYANTGTARYLTRADAGLDAKTRTAVAPATIDAGLAPVDFNNANISASFTSSKTPSHVVSPSGATQFSVLEGSPHNKVHNCIGGVGPLDPGPYGYMTNFLSPVDPVFFLHHANMDRLWEVWNAKQLVNNLPVLPTDAAERKTFLDEPFLFFFDVNGSPSSLRKAGDYLSASLIGYDYVGGYGSQSMASTAATVGATQALARVVGIVDGEQVRVKLPAGHVQAHLLGAGQPGLVAEITVDRPHAPDAPREFDVVVNAPATLSRVEADSPHYVGTIAFFGPMMAGMDHARGTTFAIPLPKVLGGLTAAAGTGGVELTFRLVPVGGGPVKPALRGVVVATTR
jgi:tyrosinase